MSTPSSLPGDASGESMAESRDPLAASKELISRWLCRKGYGGRIDMGGPSQSLSLTVPQIIDNRIVGAAANSAIS